MQNDNWYVIITLILNIFMAIGTVSAVGISLYYSYKESHKTKHFIEINSVMFFGVSSCDDGWSISLRLNINNYIEKDIICVASCSFYPFKKKNVAVLFSCYIENGLLPGYCRNKVI